MRVDEATAARVLRFVAVGAAAFVVSALYARQVRPHLLTWGATADEVSRSYPR